MSTDYRYQLDSPRVTGRRQQKGICPHCGRKSFVRYVDTENQFEYLSNEVGRCDHEHSCGYHYSPSEYFRDNQWLLEGKVQHRQMPRQAPPPPPPLQPLPMELVRQYHSPRSLFWLWLTKECASKLGLDAELLQNIYEDYHIGATQAGYVVFWQIDEQLRVRTGHIMQYDLEGHRHGYQNWIHSVLEHQGRLPEGFNLQQCFFGQHLLPRYPDKHVCLVESQKTAIIMAALHPDKLWLATCGSSGLNTDKVECLRSRRFTLFPDSGCYDKWKAIMDKTRCLQYNINDSLEPYPPNTDLVDLLLSPQ